MKCMWNMGTECGGKIQTLEILSRGAVSGLTVSICETHLAEHEAIMYLYREGYSAEDIINMPTVKRLEIIDELQNKEE